MKSSSTQSLEQKRASHAFTLVRQVASSSDEKARKEFKTQVKKLPSRIMTSGLGPALGFLEAKGLAPHLRAGLSEWIQKQSWGSGHATQENGDRLMLWIIHGSSDFLRLATAECLAYIQWVGRFTDDLLRDLKENED